MQPSEFLFFLSLCLLQLRLVIPASLPVEDRIDCHPDETASASSCQSRNCKWEKPSNPRAPSCFFDPTQSYGYKVSGTGQIVDLETGFYVSGRRIVGQPSTGIHTNPIGNVRVEAQYLTEKILRISIKDADKPNGRFEVPIRSSFPSPKKNLRNKSYEVTFDTAKFYFNVTRSDTRTVIWDTSIGPLLFSDQYLQFSARLPSDNIYGFGEHEHATFKHGTNFVKLGMFSRDQPPGRSANLYGVHPFYMGLENDGKAYGVLLLNSNAMDVTIQAAPAITYRTIGGILDFYFFLGPTPEEVVQQYTQLIGRPVMPAYWALGFQLCRYGYNHLDVVKETVERNKKYGIPQDIQYGDIDYMERQLDFTINSKTYVGLPDYVREIKKEGIRYISILDPAISANESASYEAYTRGTQLGIWIQDHTSSEPIFNKVWPDYPNVVVNTSLDWDEQVKRYRAYVAFPDFLHTNIDKWWGHLIQKFHRTLAFDGLWIDMNEPAAFVHGSVNGCPKNKYELPPYKPEILGTTLYDKTLCMSARHQGGYLEYDVHSLYGLTQSQSTLRALHATTGKRGIVISRSTYPSSGRYTGHWLGDNTSKWPDLAASIIGMMEFSLFGIPYTGADICGFFRDSTVRLCERWTQLGAFYPFSRNHNGLGNKPQDPAYFGADFALDAKRVLYIRYTLLPYLYTLFYDAHTLGSTVVRPLMHEFVKDKNTWTVDKQFLWGPALLITPVLKEGEVKVDGYFPNARWFDYRSGKEISKDDRGKVITLEAPLNYIPLHVRGGHILPLQDPANNTMFSRRKPMGLLVALDDNMEANGHLFWDDGESIDSIKTNKFQLLNFSANAHMFMIKVHINKSEDSELRNLHFEHVTIFGIKGDFSDVVDLNGTFTGSVVKTFKDGVLKIWNLSLSLQKDSVVTWKLKKKGKDNAATNLYLSAQILMLSLLASVVSRYW